MADQRTQSVKIASDYAASLAQVAAKATAAKAAYPQPQPLPEATTQAPTVPVGGR